MKKVILSILIIATSFKFVAQSSDSLEIISLRKDFETLKDSYEDLAFKVEVFNDANNKLIEPTYAHSFNCWYRIMECLFILQNRQE